MKLYYNLLEKLSWRTVKRFKPENLFSETLKNNTNGEFINEEIAERIKGGMPLMVARYGSTELSLVTNVISYRNRRNILVDSYKYLWGINSQFWEINKTKYDNLCKLSGFFPENDDNKLSEQFTDLILESSKELDILGVWVGLEDQIPTIPPHIKITGIRKLEPWFYQEPWSYQLKDKKVLVIHPFEESIISQYKKRKYLFENKKILPDFDLKTIKAIQTVGDNKDEQFRDWFEALDNMKSKINQTDFDIAIIGCGAYGFPLAAYVKQLGKQAIHLGGMVQWLFGIKGQRWLGFNNYKKMPNRHWVFPLEEEKPKGFEKVEGGCYW